MAKTIRYWEGSKSMRNDNNTFLIKLEPGDEIQEVGRGGRIWNSVHFPNGGYALAEGISYPQGNKYPVVEILRDHVEKMDDEQLIVMNNWKARAVCCRRCGKAAYKKVPGGVTPLVPNGSVLVADFNMSGTGYYIVPKKIAKDFGWII